MAANSTQRDSMAVFEELRRGLQSILGILDNLVGVVGQEVSGILESRDHPSAISVQTTIATQSLASVTVPESVGALLSEPQQSLPGNFQWTTMPGNHTNNAKRYCAMEENTVGRPAKKLKASTPLTPMVFEIPKVSWSKLVSSDQEYLLNSGPFNEGRLSHMKKIYLVHQPAAGVQITIAKSLNLPHGHVVLNSACHAKSIKGVPVVSLQPTINDVTEAEAVSDSRPIQSFVVSPDSVSIPWEEVHEFILRNASNNKKVAGAPVKRQKEFVDVGYCGGQGYTVNDADIGIHSPSELSHTRSDFVQELLGILSEACLNHCPNVWKDVSDDRRKTFANKLHSLCPFEFCRLAATPICDDETTASGKGVHFHTDNKNGGAAEVVIFSAVVGSVRIAIVCCQRKSCEDYMERTTKTIVPALRYVIETYNDIPSERKNIRDMLDALDWTNSNGLINNVPFKLVKCHLEASVYPTAVINKLLCLYVHLQLDYVELISLIVAFSVIPNAPFFFITVTSRYLSMPRMDRSGVQLGYDVAGEMVSLYKKTMTEDRAGAKIPGLRFSTYQVPTLCTYAEHFDKVRVLSGICIESLLNGDRPPSKKERNSHYKATFKQVVKSLNGCGSLIANHILQICAVCGIVPLWYAEEITGNGESRGFKFLREIHNLPRASSDSFLEDVARAVQRSGCTPFCTRRTAENIVCKVYREQQGGKMDRFSDIVLSTDYVFLPTSSGLIVYSQRGMQTELKGPLIQDWKWKGTMVKSKEMATAVSLLREKTIPTDYMFLSGFEPRVPHGHFCCASGQLFHK